MSYEEQPDDGLTAEERAALATFDQIEAQEKETQHVDQDEQQPEAAAEEPTQQADAGEPVAAADAADGAGDDAAPSAAAEQPDVAVQPAAEQPAAAQPQSAPILIVTAPEDAQAKLDDIAKRAESVVEQHENGDITTSQMHQQLNALNDEKFEIKSQLREAELAQKMEQQRLQQIWIADCNAFIAQHPEYADKDTPERKLMDETLMTLANMPTNRGLSNQEALSRAHAIVQVQLGKPVASAPAPATKTAAPPQVKKPEIPPNITALPAATMNDTQGGEFAAIESLRKSGDIEKYEEAVASLSDAARARYLRA